MSEALAKPEINSMDGYWRAAQYLSAGQVYLLDNARLKNRCNASNDEGGEPDGEMACASDAPR